VSVLDEVLDAGSLAPVHVDANLPQFVLISATIDGTSTLVGNFVTTLISR